MRPPTVRGWLVSALLLAACSSHPRVDRGRAEEDAATEDRADAATAMVRRDGAARDALAPVGTRLRTHHLYFGDRALFLAGIFDTTLEAWCQFEEASDGKLRCLPSLYPKDILYLDAACTQPVATEPPGPGNAAYASVWQRKSCGDQAFDTYRRLPETEMLPTYVRDTDNCRPNPAGMVRVHRLEKITEQAVVGTRVRGEAREGIAPVFIQAEGRQVRQQDWHDTKLDLPCWTAVLGPGDLWSTADKVFRCVPRDSWVAGVDFYFADATCQRHAASTIATCAPGRVGELYGGNEFRCPSLYRYFKLGAAQTSVYLPQGPARTCQPVAGTTLAREVLEEIPPETLPRAEVIVAPGPERIRPNLVQTAAGTTPTYHLWDETMKAHCYRQSTIEDRLRCIPDGAWFRDDHRFADAACTRPLAGSPARRCLPLAFAYLLEGTDSSRVVRVFRGPVLHQGPVFTNAGGACAAAAMKHPKGYPEYDLGAEIPLDQFAELRVAEP